MFPLCGSVFVKFIEIIVFSLFHDQRMSAAGIQARWKPWVCFHISVFFLSKRDNSLSFKSQGLTFFLSWTQRHVDDLTGCFIKCALFYSLCHISLLCVNFYKLWCFLQTGDAVIEGACMFIFWCVFFFPAACLIYNNSNWLLLKLCARVRVFEDVCELVLCFEAITVAVCDFAVTSMGVVVSRPAVRMLCRSEPRVVWGFRCCFQVQRLLSSPPAAENTVRVHSCFV